MPQLHFTQPPFDVLTPSERQSIQKHTQVRYLDKNDHLADDEKQHLFVVLKGEIQQTLNDDFVDSYTANEQRNDWFDARKQPSLTDSHANTSYHYTASEQSLLLQVSGTAVDKISAQNRLIRQLLNGEISEKMQMLKQRQHSTTTGKQLNFHEQNQAETQNLMMQPVTTIPLLPVHIIDENDSITTAAKTITKAGSKHVLIRRQTNNERHPTKSSHTLYVQGLGILTDTDICKSISDGKDPSSTACHEYASFKLRTIEHHQDMSEALLTMTRYQIHRLPVVQDNGEIIGILGQSDLMAYIGNHSQLITVQIEQVTTIKELHAPVEMIGQYIRTQQQNGIKIGIISRMVQTLNAQVFSKLWQLIVPEIVYENTCLIVMGSEGRGEQIMRTDQDNALIIRNGFNHPNLADYAEQFNQSLAAMGYPLCDGNIMMTNPMWRQSLSKLQKQVTTWFHLKKPEHGIWLAAVLDAAYVCGDERLLTSLRQHLKTAHQNSDPMMIRQFVRAALQFGDVNQWWQRFAPLVGKPKHTDIDLKKAGIFPLVHGIRTMTLEHDIYHVTSSKARLHALVRAGAMTEKRAETLIEALEFFMAQRLAVALSTEDKLARQVNPRTLSALERDLLKECLNVVKSFKNELTNHYQLSVA